MEGGGGQATLLVVGAGIAGLAAAVGAQRRGLSVKVLERAPALDGSARGELIWSSGLDALAELGVVMRGRTLVSEDFRSWRGKPLYRIPVEELATAAGRAAPVVVRRCDLLAALAGALDDGTIRFGAEVSRADQDDSGVTAHIAADGTERGDVLLAAEGARSRLRTTALGGPYAEFVPGAWVHGVVRAPDGLVPPGTTVIALGRGDRCFVRDLGDGWASWVAVVSDGRPVTRERLLERFRDFADPVRSLLEATSEDAIVAEDVRRIEPLDTWYRNRIALLGDAAHASPPDLARGAGEALRDGVAAATLVAEHGGAAGLAAYDAERRPAVAAVQAEARKIGGILGWSSAPRVALREQVMRRVLAKGAPKRVAEELRSR